MNELIKIEEKEGVESVSAKELYEFLGYDKSQWSRWAAKNIDCDSFFIHGIDYQGFDFVSNGNITKDYALSLDMAKELCMLARNDKGKEARRYFIEVEKKAKSFSVPDTFAKALLLAAEQQFKIESQEKQLALNAPKCEAYDVLIKTDTDMSITQAAKHFGKHPKTQVFPFLRLNKYLTANDMPSQSALDLDILSLKQVVCDNKTRSQTIVKAC